MKNSKLKIQKESNSFLKRIRNHIEIVDHPISKLVILFGLFYITTRSLMWSIILIILISMISGGSGSGKSHTTRTIIKYDLEQKVDKLNESLNQYNIQLSNLQGVINTRVKALETRVDALDKKVNPPS